MKKILIFAFLGILLAIFSSEVSFARGRFGDRGCDCYEKGFNGAYQNSDYKKFREESLPLRQKISEKRFEIEREYLAEHPDEAKIAKLKDEMNTLREQLNQIKTKHNIQAKRFSPRCY
ncbi:MAG: hypothetical protein OHK0040_01630 [bacterium]